MDLETQEVDKFVTEMIGVFLTEDEAMGDENSLFCADTTYGHVCIYS